MRCSNCKSEESPVVSQATGLSYCPGCGAMLGRAFDPAPQETVLTRQEAILEIILLTKQRLAGAISRQDHEARIEAILTREPELPLELAR